MTKTKFLKAKFDKLFSFLAGSSVWPQRGQEMWYSVFSLIRFFVRVYIEK